MPAHAAHVAHHRLADHRGDPLAVPPERFGQARRVVVREHERVLRRAGGDAGRVGHGQRRRRTARRHQQAVHVPVVVARELDDHVAAGVSAGEPDRAHRRFGARVDQSDLLDRRHGLDDKLGQFAFGLGRRPEAGAARDRLLQRRDDGRMAMPEDHRPPRADVVEVAIAVDVDQPGPLAALEEDRLAADRPERPRRAVHAAGDQPFRPLECLVTALVVSCCDVLDGRWAAVRQPPDQPVGARRNRHAGGMEPPTRVPIVSEQ